MGTRQILTRPSRNAAAPSALACLLAGALVLTAALAAAQEAGQRPGAKVQEERGFFGSIVRWFDEQAASINSTFKDARTRFEKFGHEATVAAKTTANTAKDAADAVARIPNARVVTGHEKCAMAPNGAPDCVLAANTMCKAKGFEFGKSVDMTTAENCPTRVWVSGRKSAGDCTTETFVSRALCQ